MKYLWILLIALSLQAQVVISPANFTSSGGGGGCSGTGDFGITSEGAFSGSTELGGNRFTATADICASKGYIYINATTSQHLKIVIWANDSGSPGDLLAYTDEITGTGSLEWLSADFTTSFQIEDDSTYWIGWVADFALPYQYATSGTAEARVYNDAYSSYPTIPDPCVASSGSLRHLSIYVSDN